MELKAFDYESYKNSGNITYDTDFEYATVESLTRLGKDWYSIKLRDNTWYRFCFRIKGCKGKEIIFDFICPDTFYPETSGGKLRWEFKEGFNRPFVSYDGKRWEQVSDISRVPTYKGYYRFKHFFEEDTAYISFNVPYTYSDLMEWLLSLESLDNVKIESIGKTRNGIEEPAVTITDNPASDKLVVLIGREDADECGGSFGVEGLVDYLLNEGKELLSKYVFKIIPMVGIDGVVAGATHSAGYGYSGFNWHKEPSPKEIENAKNAIRGWVNNGGEIVLAGKLHGASYPNVSRGLDDILACNENLRSTFYREIKRYLGDSWNPGSYNINSEWHTYSSELAVREKGYFERFIMDEFGTDHVFGTHILEGQPNEPREGGRALMHAIHVFLNENYD